MTGRMRSWGLLTMLVALTTSALSGCIALEEVATERVRVESHARPVPHHEGEAKAGGGSDNDTGSGETPEDAYLDADPRYHNVVQGDESSTRTVNVPLGTERLVVGLTHHSSGRYAFELKGPAGLLPVTTEDGSGVKRMHEPRWVDIDDPLPGDWVLMIDVSGASAYTVGFYVC